MYGSTPDEAGHGHVVTCEVERTAAGLAIRVYDDGEGGRFCLELTLPAEPLA